MMKGLIMDNLQLPTRPYCASSSCPERNLSVITDKNGLNAGMTTFVDSMQAKATATEHARIFLESEVVKISQTNQEGENGVSFTLSFANGSSVQANNLVLNLPQQPLLQLLRASPIAPLPLTSLGAKTVPTVPLPLKALKWVKGAASMKLYLIYEDAWWRNHLNLTYGYFNNSAAPSCQTSGTAIPEFPPLSGRYHDGMLICGSDGHSCRGAIEAAYAFDDVSIGYYRPYLADSTTPAMVYNWPKSSMSESSSNTTARATAAPSSDLPTASDVDSVGLLTEVHAELVHLHAAALHKAGVYDQVAAMRPTTAVLAIWDRMVAGFGAGIHDWMRDSRSTNSRPGAACTGFSDCQKNMPSLVLQPFGKSMPLFIVNEAYSSRVGWCEGSIVMAENALHRHWKLPKPDWISADIYEKWVLYNSTYDAAAR
jgi:hypothetical protein